MTHGFTNVTLLAWRQTVDRQEFPCLISPSGQLLTVSTSLIGSQHDATSRRLSALPVTKIIISHFLVESGTISEAKFVVAEAGTQDRCSPSD
jgi:hypothetical protein